MAHYHFSAQIISRGHGRSALAAAAYRAATRLTDRQTGKVHDYSAKRGLVHAEILLPRGAAPWLGHRERLWNHAHARETRRDSQLAREINLGLPHELSADQRLNLVRTFVLEEFVAKGMVADLCLHAPVVERGQDHRNHHAHIMLTLRQAEADGLHRSKTREWNSPAQLRQWRLDWERRTNLALVEARSHERVDARSLVDQRQAALAAGDHLRAHALDRTPEIHVGPAAFAMHETGRVPRRLQAVPLPPPPLAQPPALVPTTVSAAAVAPRAVHTAAIRPLQPKLAPVPVAIPLRPLTPTIVRRQRPMPRIAPIRPTPKRFVRDTWQLEIVRRQRSGAPTPRPPPLFRLVLRETRPRRAWRNKVAPQERVTRLEFNLTRIERNRTRVVTWVRRLQARRARMMLRWRTWRALMWWLIGRSGDPDQITRLFKRLMSDQKIRLALDRAVSAAKAEEARLNRRCYEVRLKLHREYLHSLHRVRRYRKR